MAQMSGGCQCGKIRFTVPIKSDEAYLCHCRMCQRATGNVSVAFVSVRKDDVSWQGEPARFASSSIASRPFCRDCGTPLGFAYEKSEYCDLMVASFDDPSGFHPTENFGAESKLTAWENTAHLPDKRADENEALSKRWEEAGE